VGEIPSNTSAKNAFKGKHIAHRFNDDWYIGVYRYSPQGAALQGQRAVYYADDRTLYMHKLADDTYGVDKFWVVVKKIPVRGADHS
jgi:hypothetical protein